MPETPSICSDQVNRPSAASPTRADLPNHVAIIMDGNRRWARQHYLPLLQGYNHGVDAVRKLVRYASICGLNYLTLYGFSTENWKRSAYEVNYLMGLIRYYLKADLAELSRNNVRLRIIGSKTGLTGSLLDNIAEAENLTRENNGLNLSIAFNYGGRDELLRAARCLAVRIAAGEIDADKISVDDLGANLDTCDLPDPDLIIRTGGEYRISNFMLWQSAYAEFVFDDTLWPDFDQASFDRALNRFRSRERRYGSGANSLPAAAMRLVGEVTP